MSTYAESLPYVVPLKAEQERSLFRKMRALPPGDARIEVRNEIILQFARWAATTAAKAAKASCGNYPEEDAISLAMLELTKLIERYDPELPDACRFVGFARQRIYGSVVTAAHRSQRHDDRNRQLPSEHSALTEAYLTGIDALIQVRANVSSVLHRRRGRASDGSDPLVGLPSKFDHLDAGAVLKLVRSSRVLKDRERQAVELYYFRGTSLQETGREMQLSRQRVHQILLDAQNKLRRHLKNPCIPR